MKASIAVAADLRSRIARGDLVDGQALPVESELMVELGVSKGVMREALRILEQQGLIEVRRGVGGGPRVRHPSIAEAAMAFGIFLQVAEVPVGDVWRSRDRLVAAAIERLASQRTDDDLRQLDDAVGQLSALVGDFDAYYGQLLDVGEPSSALREPHRRRARRGIAPHHGRRVGGRDPPGARGPDRRGPRDPGGSHDCGIVARRRRAHRAPSPGARAAGVRPAGDAHPRRGLPDEVGCRDRSRRVRGGATRSEGTA